MRPSLMIEDRATIMEVSFYLFVCLSQNL